MRLLPCAAYVDCRYYTPADYGAGQRRTGMFLPPPTAWARGRCHGCRLCETPTPRQYYWSPRSRQVIPESFTIVSSTARECGPAMPISPLGYIAAFLACHAAHVVGRQHAASFSLPCYSDAILHVGLACHYCASIVASGGIRHAGPCRLRFKRPFPSPR